MIRTLLLAVAILPCAACSTLIEGTTQEIAINTDPAGASCTLLRKDLPIATIPATPGAVTIKKTKDDITIDCSKAGYGEVKQIDKSKVDAATVGNVIAGGGVGWIVDSASGADNKYDSPVQVTMQAVPAGTAPVAPAAPVAPGSLGTAKAGS